MEQTRRGRRYSIGILIAAMAIVAIGVALRPEESGKSQRVVSSDAETLLLTRLTQERRLQELRDYISYAAQNAARGLLYLPQMEQTAVAITRNLALTGPHSAAGPAVKGVSATGGEVHFDVQVFRPDAPLMPLRSPADSPLSVSNRATLDTGDWAIAVALSREGAPVFAYGLYENAVAYHCGPLAYTRLRASIPLTNEFVGGGLFSIYGALAGVIARCGDEVVALSVDSVATALNKPVPANEWLQERYGIRTGATGEAGLRVITVWQESPAGRANLEPGDQILEIDGSKVASEAEALSLLDAAGEHKLTLRRGPRTVRTQLAAPLAPEEVTAAAAGLVLANSRDGVLVRSVAEDGPAARAGIQPGDIIERSGSAVATSAGSVAEALAQGQPVLLSINRTGSVFETKLAP